MDARLFNTRSEAMGWDMPFVGHPSMSSGEIGRLVERRTGKKSTLSAIAAAVTMTAADFPPGIRNWSRS
jgi:hypothetical protein